MPIPNVGRVLNGWTKKVTVTIVVKTVIDHEASETTTVKNNVPFQVQNTPPDSVARKPESQRHWRWKTLWVKGLQLLKIDDKITVNGITYKIGSVYDWSDGGFNKYDATEDFV